jgi:hypothetical protein
MASLDLVLHERIDRALDGVGVALLVEVRDLRAHALVVTSYDVFTCYLFHMSHAACVLLCLVSHDA